MKQILLIGVIVLTAACGNSSDSAATQGEDSSATSYEAAHAAAVVAIDYSATRGHAWTTADTLLKRAVAASANGDEALAIELANSARTQAELAARQADIEEAKWSDRVLSD
jgi:hypothetical protein